MATPAAFKVTRASRKTETRASQEEIRKYLPEPAGAPAPPAGGSTPETKGKKKGTPKRDARVSNI